MDEDPRDRELHQQLVEGDPTAPMRIAEKYLASVLGRLTARYPNLADPALTEDATHVAFLNYFREPHTYNPDNWSSVQHFLYVAAKRDLLNLLDREQTRQDRQPVRLDAVELRGPDAEYLVDDTNNPDRMDFERPDIMAKVQQVLPNPVDQQLLSLMMYSERRTAVFAQVLGIGNLPIEQQEVQVKRHKDRIKKRLQRARIWTHES